MTETPASGRLTRRELVKRAGVAGAALGSGGFFTATAFGGRRRAGTRESDEIKVGILADITGAWSVYGGALDKSARLAVDEINAGGGLLGKKLVIVGTDSATDPKVGVEKAQKLVKSEKVAVVIGSISSAMRQAVEGPIAVRGNTILMYPELYEGGDCTRNMISTAALASQQVNPFTPWLMKNYGKTFYFIGMDYSWPRTVLKYVQKSIAQSGGKLLGSEFLPIDATDFSATLTRIKKLKPKVIYQTFPGTGGLDLLKQHADLGLHGKNAIANIFMGEVEVAGLPAKVADGIVSSLDYFMALQNPMNAKYLAAYRKKYGQNALTLTTGAGAYNGVHLWAEAVKGAKSTDTDKVFDYFRKNDVTFKGPGGPISIPRGSQHAKLSIYIGRVEGGKYNIVKDFGPQPVEPACKA